MSSSSGGEVRLWNETASIEMLAQAWSACPQACAECAVNQRGCIGFSSAFLGSLRAASYGAYLLGVLLYNWRFKTTPFRTILCWAWIAHGVSLIPDLILVQRWNVPMGLPDELFMLGDNVLYTAINQMKHMPFLVLAARLCPPSIEATFFASIMSVANWGGDVARFGGAGLLAALGVTATDFENLWVAQVIRIGCCAIPALLVFALVPRGGPADAVSQFQEELEEQLRRSAAMGRSRSAGEGSGGVPRGMGYVGLDRESACGDGDGSEETESDSELRD